ncbi:IclR family transcriptional regulator [Haloarcula marina]|uniref:IclR family transcriptional regulator n=1 Tax=Haloarcula marina TaxID=2961574 RepID=UPI0020B77C70|nr:IclR family transcriptional regulator [Halomicroarcula marina]
MTKSNSIDAVQTSFEVLAKVGEMGGAGVSELATEMGRSKSTVHRHLNNLTEQNYVVQENGKYYPGLRSLRLAANALDLYDVYPISRPVVNELVSKTGESAAVAVEEKGRAVYLYHNRSNESVKTDARAGIEMFLHCTGAGKAILAHLPEERIDAVIEEHGLPKMTPNTITDRDELLAELEEIRELGYAFDDEERIEGMRGVGTPVLDRETGEPYGALTVSGPTHRIKEEQFRSEIPELLTEVKNMIEVTLTYG